MNIRNTTRVVCVLSADIYQNMTDRVFPLLACVILAYTAGCAANLNLQNARGDFNSGDYQRALGEINKSLKTHPDNPEGHLLKGDILLGMILELPDTVGRTGYVVDLVHAYQRAQELDTKHSAYVRRKQDDLYNNEFFMGLSVFPEADQLGGRERADRFMLAAQYFRNASIIFPDSSEALINEATAYYNAGEAQKAAQTYERAIAQGNTSRELFIYLARTYELMGSEINDFEAQQDHFRNMIRTLETARKHYTDDKEIRMILLNAYAMSGVDQDALLFFEEIFPLEKENQVYLYNYGTLLLKQGDYEGAINRLSGAVALDSSYAKALFNLGAAYVNYGVHVYERFKAVEDSLHMDGQNHISMEARKAALEQDKEKLFQQAITYLEAARRFLENEPEEMPSICRALYQAYAQTNQRSRAEEVSTCISHSGG